MAAFLQFFLSYGIRRIRCLGRSRLKCSQADEALTLMSHCTVIICSVDNGECMKCLSVMLGHCNHNNSAVVRCCDRLMTRDGRGGGGCQYVINHTAYITYSTWPLPLQPCPLLHEFLSSSEIFANKPNYAWLYGRLYNRK